MTTFQSSPFTNLFTCTRLLGSHSLALQSTRFSLPLLNLGARRFKLFYVSVPDRHTHVDTLPQKNAADLALELLEWRRVCQIVSGFAGTTSAKELLQEFEIPRTQIESEDLLSKTAAAIDLLALLGTNLDFGGIQTKLVHSSITRLQKGFVITGHEAVAISTLIQFTDTIQRDTKMGVEHYDYSRNILSPVLDMIRTKGGQPEVLKAIWKVVDADGIVKDSASSELQRARIQENMLKTKAQQLLSSILRDQESEARTEEVDGRLCIVVSTDNQKKFPGLLLQSGSGGSMSYVEPIAAVSLNNKLAEARASVLKAEYEALSALSHKLMAHSDNIGVILDAVIQLDLIVARAKFSLTYKGSRPIFTVSEEISPSTHSGSKQNIEGSDLSSAEDGPGKKVLLQLRQAYHPLLLQQYQEYANNQKTRTYGIRINPSIRPPKPVPIDVTVCKQTRVVIITGPNTGGKTAAMKMIGLAVLMAKSGLYVLAAHPVYLPWFDAVFADIGDEQSLSQSLSTFSGHLRRINNIKESSTGDSLVLLDEVGTGTNPIEGAALGMSILEGFARNEVGGSRLALGSTHHAELKTLKYSDSRFENASVEFDEETLKPTFRLLYGIPGRSNALNISKRLGVPKHILQAAQKLHGVASAEINQVIMDLERLKLDFENNLAEAEQYLKNAKMLHKTLNEAVKRVQEKGQVCHLNAASMLQEEAHMARSALSGLYGKKLSAVETTPTSHDRNLGESTGTLSTSNEQDGDATPKIGEMVYIPRLGKEAKVIQMLLQKKMVVVQSGLLQLRLKLSEVQ